MNPRPQWTHAKLPLPPKRGKSTPLPHLEVRGARVPWHSISITLSREVSFTSGLRRCALTVRSGAYLTTFILFSAFVAPHPKLKEEEFNLGCYFSSYCCQHPESCRKTGTWTEGSLTGFRVSWLTIHSKQVTWFLYALVFSSINWDQYPFICVRANEIIYAKCFVNQKSTFIYNKVISFFLN